MKYQFICILFIGFITQKYSKKASETTPLLERIEKLKQQLKYDIKTKIFDKSAADDKLAFSNENYDFIQDRDIKITPIMKTKRHKRKELKNLTVDLTTPTGSKAFYNQSNLRSKIKKRIKIKKPLEIFYRRYNEDILHKQLPWAHCQYMMTPFITGIQTDLTKAKRLLGLKDPMIVRLNQLFSIDASTLNKEDVYSILYQISNLQIRLYQWDDPAIKHLLNVVIKDKVHSFRTLKHSLRSMFDDWKLDVSNATSLLKQTRIFRPPCVRVSDLDGSTKSPKISTYPKKRTQPTKFTKSEDHDDSDI